MVSARRLLGTVVLLLACPVQAMHATYNSDQPRTLGQEQLGQAFLVSNGDGRPRRRLATTLGATDSAAPPSLVGQNVVPSTPWVRVRRWVDEWRCCGKRRLAAGAESAAVEAKRAAEEKAAAEKAAAEKAAAEKAAAEQNAAEKTAAAEKDAAAKITADEKMAADEKKSAGTYPERQQAPTLSADPPGHPGTIIVATLGGTTKEVSVVAGQTVRDLRRELCATLGPLLGPHIKLINADHVLQDDEGLDGVTDVTAVRSYPVVVARREWRRTLMENNADAIKVEGMGEDIIWRKAPAGAQTGNPRRPQDVPLYHMRNANNEELILGEFGLWCGSVKASSNPYVFLWPENWTPENVGVVNMKLWEDFVDWETQWKLSGKIFY